MAGRADRALRRRATASRCACASTTGWRRCATRSRRRSRAHGAGHGRTGPARGPRGAGRARRARDRRHRRRPAHLRASSAHDHPRDPPAAERPRRRPARASSRSRGRSPRPTSSCASTAPCSATHGRSCAPSRCSACSGSSSPRSPTSATNVKNYPAYILLSMTIFQFFRAIVDNGCCLLVTRENLLRKMRFPRLVIPMAVTLGALFELGADARRRRRSSSSSPASSPTWGWLELIPLLAMLSRCSATGLGPAAVRALRPLPRHGADLGRRRRRCSSTRRRSSTSATTVPEECAAALPAATRSRRCSRRCATRVIDPTAPTRRRR